MQIDAKLRNIRYVCECTKFRLFPPGLLLSAFSSLLEDLTPHRIEMLSHLAAVSRGRLAGIYNMR